VRASALALALALALAPGAAAADDCPRQLRLQVAQAARVYLPDAPYERLSCHGTSEIFLLLQSREPEPIFGFRFTKTRARIARVFAREGLL